MKDQATTLDNLTETVQDNVCSETGNIVKDTLCHDLHVQSLEVRCWEVLLELFPKVKEGVETVRDQDVLQREGIKLRM